MVVCQCRVLASLRSVAYLACHVTLAGGVSLALVSEPPSTMGVIAASRSVAASICGRCGLGCLSFDLQAAHI